MKTVYLARHAKSSWENPETVDHDRPLIQKGIARTLLIAKYLKERNVIPSIIISSTAVRAKETVSVYARELNIEKHVINYDKRLYFNDADDFFNILYELPDEINSVMFVGHNPSMSEFVSLLAKSTYEELATSAIACVVLNTDKWTEAATCKTEMKFFIYPKMIKKEI